MCEIIKQNPKAIIDYFDFVCEAFAEYENAPESLTEMFRMILKTFKDSSGDSWSKFYTSFNQDLQEKLRTKFDI
jgi:hypothetical protein